MHLSALHVYPVKGCRGLDPRDAEVEPWGLRGDRRWMIVDRDGLFLTQREEPLLATVEVLFRENGLELRRGERRLLVETPDVEAPRREVRIWRSTVPARIASRSLDELLGRDLALAYMDDPTVRPTNPEIGRAEDRVSFADGYPLLLTTEESLADLNARMPAPLPMARFRPSVVIAGARAWDEDMWRVVRIGAVAFRVVKPCDRCIVTTTDQVTGARGGAGGEPLRTLARFRRRDGAVFFGQNLVPDGTGTIRVGAPVEVLVKADRPNWV